MYLIDIDFELNVQFYAVNFVIARSILTVVLCKIIYCLGNAYSY